MKNHVHITTVGAGAQPVFQNLLKMRHKHAMISCCATVYDVPACPEPGRWQVKAAA